MGHYRKKDVNVLSVHLLFTDSDYPIGIFKLIFPNVNFIQNGRTEVEPHESISAKLIMDLLRFAKQS